MGTLEEHWEAAGERFIIFGETVQDVLDFLAADFFQRAEKLAAAIHEESLKAAARIGTIQTWSLMQSEYESLAKQVSEAVYVDHFHEAVEPEEENGLTPPATITLTNADLQEQYRAGYEAAMAEIKAIKKTKKVANAIPQD